MAKIYRADDEASRRAAAALGNSIDEFSQPAPKRPQVAAPVAPATPTARPQIQQPQSSATSVGRSLGNTVAGAMDLMGTPQRLALDGLNAAAMYGRNIVRGALGKPALEPAQLKPNRVQGWLAAARASNAAPVASTAATPAPTRPPIAPTPAPRPAPAQAAPTNQPQASTAQPAPSVRTDGITVGRGQFGETTYTGSGKSVADAAARYGNVMDSVAAQNFGTVPTTGRPQVASTFGMSVNDPRLNDQTQRPQIPTQYANRDTGTNFRMQVPNGAGFRSADQMSEVYNANDDRKARQKLASDMDSERFRLGMIAGNPGRRGRAAIAALGQLAGDQAQLASGAEGLSAAAIQNRANRANTLDNTGLQEQGQTFRTQLDGQNRADIAAMQNATEQQRIAAGITRPMVQGADGSYYQIDPNTAAGAAVTDAQGKPIRGPAQRPQIDGALEGKRLEQIGALANQLLGVDPTTGQIQDGDKSRAPTPEEVLAARDVAARAIVGGGGGQQQPQMRAGEVRNGVRFKGGDPNDENNYERVTAAGR